MVSLFVSVVDLNLCHFKCVKDATARRFLGHRHEFEEQEAVLERQEIAFVVHIGSRRRVLQ